MRPFVPEWPYRSTSIPPFVPEWRTRIGIISPMDDLRGRTVLLTGASTGLGPHIARRLSRAGAKFVLSARHGEALTRLAEELGHSRVVVADLSRPGVAERLAREAGDVDGLVANEGEPAGGRRATFKAGAVE